MLKKSLFSREQCVTRPKILPRPVPGLLTFRYQIFSETVLGLFSVPNSLRDWFRDFFRYQIFFETDSETFFNAKFLSDPYDGYTTDDVDEHWCFQEKDLDCQELLCPLGWQWSSEREECSLKKGDSASSFTIFIIATSYSLVRLVWPNTEELISWPFMGL